MDAAAAGNAPSGAPAPPLLNDEQWSRMEPPVPDRTHAAHGRGGRLALPRMDVAKGVVGGGVVAPPAAAGRAQVHPGGTLYLFTPC